MRDFLYNTRMVLPSMRLPGVLRLFISGNTVGLYLIVKDITKQKQAEEFLQQAEKLSMIGELAAGIAHEIRNPLTSLRGFVQLFQSEDIYR